MTVRHAQDRRGRAMLLNPNGKCDLEHRAYFLRGLAGRSPVVAASEDGHVSVFGSEFSPLLRQRLATKLRAVSPHPSEPLLAWASGDTGSLVVQTLAGERVADLRPPQWRKDASKWTKQGFDDCFFDEGGEFLWVIGPISDEEIEVRLVDASDWSTVQKATVEDQFGASSSSLHGTGRPGLVALWVAAGQDGQQVHWLRREGSRFTCEPADNLANTTPPVFSPDGSEYLALSESHAIRKYGTQTHKPMGAPLESADDDNPFAESMCYLDRRHALAGTNGGQLYLIDTERMQAVEEVVVAGHEPRPIGEYYPTLAKEPGLATDISWFTRLGKAVVFVYRRDRGTGLRGWKDSLLWYFV